MKRTLLLGLLAACCTLSLSLGLAACGGDDDGQDGLAYRYDDDRKAYAVTGFTQLPTDAEVEADPGLLPTELTIPAAYREKPVYIADGAFAGYDFLKKVTLDAGVLSIGDNAFANCIALASVNFPTGLESVGKGAFANCTALTAVELPATLTGLGEAAFTGCTALGTLSVDAQNTAFSSAGNILYDKGQTKIVCISSTLGGEIDLPATLKDLGEGTFLGHAALTSVTLHDGIEKIGADVFKNCTSLTAVTLPTTVKEIGDAAFSNCTALPAVTLSDGVKSIGAGAFENCDKLTSVALPATVETVGARAFASCDALTAVTLPQALKKIPERLFADCGKLASADIHDAVTEIGSYAFSGCVSLGEAHLPAGLIKLGERAFFGCSSITGFTVEDGNTAYHVQDGCLIETANKALLYGCDRESVDLSREDLVSVAPNAFRFMEHVQSIHFPAGLSTIGDDAFFGCSALKAIDVAEESTAFAAKSGVLYRKDGTGYSFFLIPAMLGGDIEIPAGVTAVPDSAFAGRAITSVKLPEGLKTVGKNAFAGCTQLQTADVPKDVESFGERAFADCTSLSAFSVPDASEESYVFTTLSKQMFYGCTSLTNVTLGDHVSTVGEDVFDGCAALAEIEVSDKNNTYSNYNGDKLLYAIGQRTEGSETVKVFSDLVHVPILAAGEVVIPDGISEIEAGAFEGRTQITSVSIPARVSTLGAKTFFGCTSLAEVIFRTGTDSEGQTEESALLSIGSHAFEGCERLTGIALPAALLSIGDYAFANTGLTSVTIPKGVTSVGERAFAGCGSLFSVTFATQGEDGSYRSVQIGVCAFKDCTSLNTVTLCKEISSIGSYAFENCTAITTATYPGTKDDWERIAGSGNELLEQKLFPGAVS